MERPRLLRTYTGLKGSRPGLRARPALEWFPPASLGGGDLGEDRKRIFSSSASSAGASFEDPDFPPPEKERRKGRPPRTRKERARPPRKGKKRARPPRKKEEEEEEGKGPKENLVPPTPLRRNITLRRKAQPRRPPSPLPAHGEAPLLCSTPQTAARAPPGEGPGLWDAFYGFQKEDGPPDHDSEASSFFDEEDEDNEKDLCAEAPFYRERRPSAEVSPKDSATQPYSSRHHQEDSPPFQSHSTTPSNDIWSKQEKDLCAEAPFYGERHPSAQKQRDSATRPQSSRHHREDPPPFQSHPTKRANIRSKQEKDRCAEAPLYAQEHSHPSALLSTGEASSRRWEGSVADSPFQHCSTEQLSDTWSKEEASLRHWEDQSDSAAQPRDIWSKKASLRNWEYQSDSAAQPRDIWRKEKPSLRHREDRSDAAAQPQDIWRKEKTSLRHQEYQSDSFAQPQSPRHHQDDSLADPPFQNNSLQPQDIWSKEKTSSRRREDESDSSAQSQPSRSPDWATATPGRGTASSGQQEDFVASVQDQTTAVPLKTEACPSKGACQLQARFSDGKLALSLPREHAPLAQKRQRMKKAPTELGSTSSEELGEGRIDGKSPLLQPIVVLDNQAVPNWLASKCYEERVLDCHSEKIEDASRPRSPCNLPARSTRRAPPVCNTATTGRKACISGFSSKRWGQQKKPKERHGKKKQQVEQSLQNQVDDDNNNNLALSFLSPESSFQNSALWRRIRATFSFHKKKKILSESESFIGSSIGAGGSFRLYGNETPQSPFTQRMSYSICPSSSMVLLSPFSVSQVMPTDAEKVYGECQQKGPISFEECLPLRTMRKCEKIGEGVFGEVFRAEGERGAVALKIIPIEGAERVNGEPQKTFGEILPEIIISKELSLLAEDGEEENQVSGFIRLHSVHCVQGAYPEALLDAWDEFHRRRTSENDRPDFFEARQLFMVLEFEDGGTDLENMRKRKLGSVATAKSVLQQVAASLAVAEEALRFEHRDLHWGNVLVKSTARKEVSVRLKGETLAFPTCGILVSIIDYTFSRLERDGLTVYCDLSTDEEVFQGRGDYQFDVYRQMREENGNEWADYFPHSNILWLHYLAEKLLTEVTYKTKPTSPALKRLQKELKSFSGELLGFQSAGDLLKGSPFFQ
nr:serine/threonine-protein kinase haspin [Anolis sagrei ordinatus]